MSTGASALIAHAASAAATWVDPSREPGTVAEATLSEPVPLGPVVPFPLQYIRPDTSRGPASFSSSARACSSGT
jgi:hypothetical protein